MAVMLKNAVTAVKAQSKQKMHSYDDAFVDEETSSLQLIAESIASK